MARPEPDLDDGPWHDPLATARAMRAAAASTASRAGGRRRLIDPTTCERDYTPDELEFMTAIQAYQAASGRKFPTLSETLQVLLDLGYVRPLPDHSDPGKDGS